MKKIIHANLSIGNIAKFSVFIGLLLGTNYSLVTAANSQWYWVSIPDSPMTGYFIEDILPTTIGYTNNNQISEGNRTVVPEEFMDVMKDTKDSSKCTNGLDSAIMQLRNFDSSEELVIPGIKCHGECSSYYTQETLKRRENLLLSLMNDAKRCLVNEEQAILKAEEERKQKEAIEQRIKDVANAVARCDFDYFENEMTNDERMATYRERTACKENTASQEQMVISPTTENTAITSTPIIPAITKTTQEATSDVTESANGEQPVAENIDISDPETHQTNSEGSDPKPQDVVSTEQPQPEQPKESFLKRIVKFIFGWW